MAGQLRLPTRSLAVCAALLACAACASDPDAPLADPLAGYEQVQPAVAATPSAAASTFPGERVERGQYLVDLLGCGSCHTDGALLGEPNGERLLAGSAVGIATSSPMQVRRPGVVFPSNLTPDPGTGIGNWTLQQIVAFLQSGVDRHGSESLPIMPFMTYSRLQAADAEAVAMYLKSLPPVVHRVPAKVSPGQRTRAPYVHFGVYRSAQ